MYLSRMYLNPQRRQGRALLASPQKMHAAVLSSFPTIPVENDERVLWRLDRVHEKCVLYMVSPGVPSFEHLQEQAGWSQQQTWDTRDYSTLLDRLLRGQRYYFRLTANPVVATRVDGKQKRLPHVTPAQQQQWLLERQERMGILLSDDSVQVVGRERLSFDRRGKKVTLVRATFEGMLEVADVEKLKKVLTQGIGKAKGYGCGLLTLANPEVQ